MNELIERLAEQAHKDVRSDEEANGVCFKDYNSAFHTAFAHLIVKTVMDDVIQGVPLAGIAKKDVFKLFGIDYYISLRCEVKE